MISYTNVRVSQNNQQVQDHINRCGYAQILEVKVTPTHPNRPSTQGLKQRARLYCKLENTTIDSNDAGICIASTVHTYCHALCKNIL